MAKKSKKLVIQKDPNCLNCGYPFSGYELFCPECGQKNKGDKLTFGSFIKEIFNGFVSWDAKFWRTIVPLIIAPGKVSKDYIEGKRSRYANPFRFYLTVSILFFLIVGLTENYSKFNDLRGGKKKQEISFISFDEKSNKNIDIDSLKNAVNEELKNSWIPIDSLKRKEIVERVAEEAKDTTKTTSKSGSQISFEGLRIDKFMSYQKKHPKALANEALDKKKKHLAIDFGIHEQELPILLCQRKGKQQNSAGKYCLTLPLLYLFYCHFLHSFYDLFIYEESLLI